MMGAYGPSPALAMPICMDTCICNFCSSYFHKIITCTCHVIFIDCLAHCSELYWSLHWCQNLRLAIDGAINWQQNYITWRKTMPNHSLSDLRCVAQPTAGMKQSNFCTCQHYWRSMHKALGEEYMGTYANLKKVLLATLRPDSDEDCTD